jgi:hypothetical protein
VGIFLQVITWLEEGDLLPKVLSFPSYMLLEDVTLDRQKF